MLTRCQTETECSNEFPEPGAVLAPWVKLEFLNGGNTITVGNDSSNTDEKNTAVIKSFEFAAENALVMKVEIHDQNGGNFVTFMESLVKDLVCVGPQATNTIVRVTFGWVKSFCNNGCSNVTQVNSSCAFHGFPMNVETNFTQGKFIFSVTIQDGVTFSIDGQKIPDVKGNDGEKMYLTDAIRELLTNPDTPPVVESVEFLQYNRNGKTSSPLLFKEYDLDWQDLGSIDYKEKLYEAKTKGPKGVWHTKARDKLSAAKDWMAEHLSADDKAIIPSYDSCDVKGGKVIFSETIMPKPNEIKNQFPCVGNYMVNGGKDSRVLEFNPRVQWNFSQLTVGGNMPTVGPAGALDPGNVKPGVPESTTLTRKDPGNQYAGAESSIAATDELASRYNAEADLIASNGQSAQALAMNQSFGSITADLRIIGDPKFNPAFSIGSYVTILFLNPYYIFESGDCGEWLAKPTCNEVLTNRGWMINSVNHKIQDGSYVTTLNLTLAASGVDIDKWQHLGADAQGWAPPDCLGNAIPKPES